MMWPVDLRTSLWPQAGLAFDRSMADLLCHRSFFSCKDNTLNVWINNNNNNNTVAEFGDHRYSVRRLPWLGPPLDALPSNSMVCFQCRVLVFVFRCHLVMRIRGSHDGEVARAAWNVFKRNGIIPSDDAHNARVDNDGDNAGVGDEEPKAVLLSLEERVVVLRLVKQVSVSVSGFRSTIDHSVSLLLSAPLEPN